MAESKVKSPKFVRWSEFLSGNIKAIIYHGELKNDCFDHMNLALQVVWKYKKALDKYGDVATWARGLDERMFQYYIDDLFMGCNSRCITVILTSLKCTDAPTVEGLQRNNWEFEGYFVDASENRRGKIVRVRGKFDNKNSANRWFEVIV